MTNKQLLEIIKKALKNEKYTKKAENEKEILIQADTNGLVPLLFKGVDKGVFSEKNYKNLKKRFFANVYSDNKQKEIIKLVNKIFNENKIEHIFLKGTHLKEIYPESYYRPMGDIDVLIPKDKIDFSREIFQKENFKTYSRTAEHDVYLYEGYFVEVHRDIYQKEDTKDNSPLLKPWSFKTEGLNYRKNLLYAFEGVYLLYHLKKHVLTSGIGIRSILDISVFFNYYGKQIDKTSLKELLGKTDLEAFFQTVLYINEKALGVNSTFLNSEFKLKDEDYNQILDYITTSGTHGKAGNINLMAPRVAKKGKFKTFFRLIFPKWDFMKENFPWLKYLPFLLPIAYIIRGLEYLFFKTKYTFKKLLNVSKSKQEAEDLDNIFKKMGI